MSYQSEVLQDGPLGYWRLGDAAGSASAADLGSGAHAATAVGSPSFGVGGNVQGDAACDLNVAVNNQYLNAGTVSYDLVGALTIEAWIKPSALPATTGRVLAKDGAYGFGLLSTGKLRFTTFGTLDYSSSTMPALVAGTWYHVACVLDSSVDATFFVNGVQYDTIAGAVAPAVSALPLLIGMRGTALTEPYKGTLDEVALYASALSATRLLAHYNANSDPSPGHLGGRFVQKQYPQFITHPDVR